MTFRPVLWRTFDPDGGVHHYCRKPENVAAEVAWATEDERATVHHGDCLDVMKRIDAESIDAVVCDPPYALTANKRGGSGLASVNLESPYGRARIGTGNGGGFMGKEWDAALPTVEMWAAALRLAKPGAHLLAFGGTRTFHRLTCAIEDAGWEIRDCLSWLYGSGFPKSHDVSKAIDKAGGAGSGWFIDYCLDVAATRGITKRQLSDLFPSKNGNPTGWLYNKASHNQDLTPSQFNALRDFLGLPFPDLASAKREVIGRGVAGLTAGSIANFSGEREFDITAPSTSLAKKWHGWGTALKPAWEPVILARKPLIGTVASNVSSHGTGALNIDGCRIGTAGGTTKGSPPKGASNGVYGDGINGACDIVDIGAGRWPANVALDEEAARALDEQSGHTVSNDPGTTHVNDPFFGLKGERRNAGYEGDSGGASRFFYTAKASRSEREAGLTGVECEPPQKYGLKAVDGNPRKPAACTALKSVRNIHPTVKPVDLMRWLVRLVTPLGGTVLDPFLGSGTTGVAALQEGCRFVGIEREAQYVEIAKARIANEAKQGSLFGGAS